MPSMKREYSVLIPTSQKALQMSEKFMIHFLFYLVKLIVFCDTCIMPTDGGK